jgi:predicted nucleic acid-binding protein
MAACGRYGSNGGLGGGAMNGYGLDSDIIIAREHGNNLVQRRIDESWAKGLPVIIPPFAYYEAKRGIVNGRAPKQLRLFEELLEQCPVGETTQEVFDRAASIYDDLKSHGHSCGDMDILIAAFCMTFGLTLVTNNTKHFENIAGLDREDWSKD